MQTYEAIVLDVDGTLLNSQETILPRVRERLHRAMECGVQVMMATGRSAMNARPVARELGSPLPSVVFNGAGLYCAQTNRFLQTKFLDQALVARLIAEARRQGLFWFVGQEAGTTLGAPHSSEDRQMTRHFKGHMLHSQGDRVPDRVVRMTIMSRERTPQGHPSFARFLALDPCEDANATHFGEEAPPPPQDRERRRLEFHPRSASKAEAIHYLEREFGIPASRIVAVGDAANDLPMLRAAGLAISMENASLEVREACDRTIGHHNSPTIADLVDELFL